MDKKSRCPHAEHPGFTGLGELSSKANLNGISRGLTSLAEDVIPFIFPQVYSKFFSLIGNDLTRNTILTICFRLNAKNAINIMD